MTPTEFVLWLNGALGVMGDTPTPEQMAKVRDKLGEAIGKITADRLLERADEQVKRDKERAEKEAEMAKVKAQMQVQMQAMMLSQRLDVEALRALTSGYAAKTDAYTATPDEYSQTLSAGVGGLPPGTIIGKTSSSPKPSGGIFGSLLRPAAKARA